MPACETHRILRVGKAKSIFCADIVQTPPAHSKHDRMSSSFARSWFSAGEKVDEIARTAQWRSAGEEEEGVARHEGNYHK